MPRVAVDALGGDNAPAEVILGARDAANDGIEVTLYGPAGLDTHGLPLVEAPDRIEMADKPAEAVRAKPDSSLVAAVRAVGAATRTRSCRPATPARCWPPACCTCAGSRA